MPTPTPETRYERQGDWLVVRSKGALVPGWFATIVTEIAAAARAEPTAAVLFDIRELSGTLDEFERYQIGVLAAQQGIPGPIATVGHEPLVDARRLGETVARNRGANIRAFTDYDAAVAWLRETLEGAS